MVIFYVLSLFWKLIRLKKLMCILRININIYRCKFGFIFLQLYCSLPRVGGKVKLYCAFGKVDLIKTVKDTCITNFIS